MGVAGTAVVIANEAGRSKLPVVSGWCCLKIGVDYANSVVRESTVWAGLKRATRVERREPIDSSCRRRTRRSLRTTLWRVTTLIRCRNFVLRGEYISRYCTRIGASFDTCNTICTCGGGEVDIEGYQ